MSTQIRVYKKITCKVIKILYIYICMFACVYVCVCYIRRQAIWKARAGGSTDFGAVLCKYLSSWGQPACLQVTIYVNVAHAFRIPYVRRGTRSDCSSRGNSTLWKILPSGYFSDHCNLNRFIPGRKANYPSFPHNLPLTLCS